ncbi:MAG: hypothetical protein ACRCSX_08630 [Allorhizobium sp.]
MKRLGPMISMLLIGLPVQAEGSREAFLTCLQSKIEFAVKDCTFSPISGGEFVEECDWHLRDMRKDPSFDGMTEKQLAVVEADMHRQAAKAAQMTVERLCSK